MSGNFLATPGNAAAARSTSQSVDWPSPWVDYASYELPQSLPQVLRWAEFIWLSNGTYRTASSRVARYFITNIRIKDLEDDVAQKVLEVFDTKLKIKQTLAYLGDMRMCYGNNFIALRQPFSRYLQCHCGHAVPFRIAEENDLYAFEAGEFKKGRKGCPQCGMSHRHLPWRIIDDHSRDIKDLKIMSFSPHEIEIGYNPYSGAKRFWWNITPQLQTDIQKAAPLALRDTPVEIMRAITDTKGRFRFHDDVIFHDAEPAPIGLYTGGWGIPRVISNFRLAFQYQVLNRYDQAIAMDYINGMRVISPEQGTGAAGAGDPILGIGGAQFNRMVQSMIKTHRRDAASWHISGFPLKYQLFGGEGSQLSPKDLMEYKLNEWLDASGFPAQMFHGDLSVQVAPMALRLFESTWPEIPAFYNNVLEWVAKFIQIHFNLPPFRAELEPVRFADDMERKAIIMELMAGQQISPPTALRTLGITDPREELRNVFDWERMKAEEEKKFQDSMTKLEEADLIKQDMQARAQGMPPGGGDPAAAGGAPPGGAPMDPAAMGGGAGGPIQVGDTSSPEAMQAEAERIAQQIITMDPTARRRTLVDLKKTNESLHALVKSKLETMENQAASQGKQMARQGQM